MYENFGVGPEIREEVNDICPRFLRQLPKHHLSTPSRHSLRSEERRVGKECVQ